MRAVERKPERRVDGERDEGVFRLVGGADRQDQLDLLTQDVGGQPSVGEFEEARVLADPDHPEVGPQVGLELRDTCRNDGRRARG
jgi:hypothetical protein